MAKWRVIISNFTVFGGFFQGEKKKKKKEHSKERIWLICQILNKEEVKPNSEEHKGLGYCTAKKAGES